MARWLRQSTSVDVPIGPFVDQTDGFTAETALTITQPDIRLKKNGAAWAQKNAVQTLLHEENGWYEVTLDATDTNTLGLLQLAVAEAGALPVWCEFLVVPANVWDSLFSTDLLQVDLQQWIGVAPDALITGDVPANAQVVADKTGYAVTTAQEDAIVDKMWDEGRTAHVADGSMGQTMQIVRSATAQAGAAGTITLDASASAVDDFYNDLVVQIIGGTGAGQARLISDYVGSTKVATIVPNWATNPDATSVFLLRPAAREDIALWLGVAPLAVVAGRVVVDVAAINSATGGIAAISRAWRSIVEGTVAAGATTTSIPTSSLAPAVTVTDQLRGRIVIFDEDTATAALRGQATDITASTSGGTLTVTALTTAPASGDTFVVV